MKFVKPKNLPQKAFDVWEEVFNANKKKVGDKRAAKIAWAAVKKGWKKVGEKWTRKTASEIKNPRKFHGSVTDLVGLGLDPATNNSSKIEVLKTGIWHHPIYGELAISNSRLERFKENFDGGIRKGVAIDIEHKSDEGAVGWVKNLTIEDNSLVALIEWTPEGIQLIRNKKYRFFSPEFDDFYEDNKTGEEYRDVLIGGAITNRPFLQELEEIILSEKFKEKIKKKKGGEKNKKTMNIKELKKKLLTDPDFSPKKKDKVSEKMLSEVKDEIKAEAKANKKKKLTKKSVKSKKVKNDKTITLSEDHVARLEKSAEEGRKALREVRKIRLNKKLSEFVYSEEKNKDGTLLPKSEKIARKLLFSLGANQRKTFISLLESLPKIGIFSEAGMDIPNADKKTAPKNVDDYSFQLSERATKLREEKPEKFKTLSEAMYAAEQELKAEGVKPE